MSTQTTENERNKAVLASTSGGGIGGGVGESIKNLSTIVKLAKSKLTKLKKAGLPNTKANSKTDFLTPKAKKIFIPLWKAFKEAPILRHFDPKRHIRIENNVSGYAIGEVLSQMILDYSNHLDQLFSNHVTHKNLNLISFKSKIGQWHPIAFFSQKMIPAETRYKIHDQKLLVIIEAFKTWRHYLKRCKYKVLVFITDNNFCQFMDTKSLSSYQVRWVQELSWYHFQIHYCQGKANAVADALFCFSKRSQAKKKMLLDENTQIFYYLQTSLTKASLAKLSLLDHKTANLSLLHQLFIYGIHVLPW